MAKSEKQGDAKNAGNKAEVKEEVKKPTSEQQPPKGVEGNDASKSASSASSSSAGSETGSGSASSSSGSSKSADKASGKAQQQGAPPQQQQRGDRTLEGLTIEMHSGKRLLVDMKENFRGKFIKMAERGGRVRMMGAVPDRVNVPLRIAKMMAERLDEFIDKAEELAEKSDKRQPLGESSASNQQRGVLHSAAFHEEGRRYFIDLLPSRIKDREPMLRIAASNQGQRSAVVIESDGIAALKEVLNTLLEKYKHDVDEEERFSHRELQFGRKRFYFDPITQQRGHSIKITEVFRSNDQLMRNTIVVPDRVLAKFADLLRTYDTQMNGNGDDGDGQEGKGSAKQGSEPGDHNVETKGKDGSEAD